MAPAAGQEEMLVEKQEQKDMSVLGKSLHGAC